VMDLGATICTPRKPACALCPWSHLCEARRLGIQATLPAKGRKIPKPARQGVVWAAFRQDGALVLEERPASGLLGGMLGLPGDGWDGAGGPAPFEAAWSNAGELRHVFTHFTLTLSVMVARVDGVVPPHRGAFVTPYRPDDLPTLMRKAHEIALAALMQT
jgi:A/G-specific adenine glycosylase